MILKVYFDGNILIIETFLSKKYKYISGSKVHNNFFNTKIKYTMQLDFPQYNSSISQNHVIFPNYL